MDLRRSSPVSIVLSCIVLLAFAIVPVHGDVAWPTNTYVYFEQNGTPYRGSIQFTVNCYGYSTGVPGAIPILSNVLTTPSDEIVFSYSAACPGYGCVIYEPYYLNYRHIDRCELIGRADNRSFSIPDYSDTPVPPNCTFIQPFDIETEDGYYNTTPEYDICRDKQFYNCDQYLKKVDPSSMLMYVDNRTGQVMPAMEICEQHFTIPQPGTSTSIFPPQGPDYSSKSPVEHLYCSFLSLFGVRC